MPRVAYRLATPPLRGDLRGEPNAVLRAYRRWFEDNLAARIAMLTAAVRATPGFTRWKPDRSRRSLAPLERWLARRVRTWPLTRAELEAHEEASRRTFPVDPPPFELTDRTLSLALDVGMYLGETMIAAVPGARWDQPLRAKLYVDRGQLVVRGPGTVPLNPVRVVEVVCQRIADGRAGELPELPRLYDVWERLLRGA